MKHILISCLSIFLLCISAKAGPYEEALRFYKTGDYSKAIEILEPVVKKSPRDLNAKVLLGRSLAESGDYQAGREILLEAEKRGSGDASKFLAQYALDDYDTATAESHIEKWRGKLSKTKKPLPEELQEMQTRCVELKNMLGHVEKILVIDSVTVDKDKFFNHYRLSREAGNIFSGTDLRSPEMNVVYVPENKREMIWSETDTAGLSVLMNADILDDGSVDSRHVLDINQGGEGSNDYPFLMSDGITLYFANDGEGSLGGYDIFMTRRDGDNFLEPMNVGMPYNSPANDYMMVLDESTGFGWWATDRNAPDGKVTIYTFVISDVRVNYSTDEENIKEYAKLSDIRATWGETDVEPYLEKLRAIEESNNQEENSEYDENVTLTLSLGNGKTITNLDEIQDSRAYAAAKELIKAKYKLSTSKRRLESLRKAWREGNHGVSNEILSLEKSIPEMEENIRKLAGTVINLEVSE